MIVLEFVIWNLSNSIGIDAQFIVQSYFQMMKMNSEKHQSSTLISMCDRVKSRENQTNQCAMYVTFGDNIRSVLNRHLTSRTHTAMVACVPRRLS